MPHPAPRPCRSLRSLARPLRSRFPPPSATAVASAPAHCVSAALLADTALSFVRCVSLPSSAVLLVAVAVALRCAPKGFITAKKRLLRCSALGRSLSKATRERRRRFHRLRLHFTRHCARFRTRLLFHLRQVPHCALKVFRSCESESADSLLAGGAAYLHRQKEKHQPEG